ncbi:MAG TPA: V-type ATP synthase subunit F [Streptosporangiaceae bacterium]|nr:V-type ATP synthase subunit F [Streptosporangiaceae bacterium]
MSRAAVIGQVLRVQGFALAGAVVCAAESQDEARAAWQSLPPDVAVVILTAGAAAWLGEDLNQRPDVLPVVMRA